MNLIPTWPIAAGALVIGLVAGAGITTTIKNAKIDRITAAHAEESRQRELVRADDERVARAKENELQHNAGVREQENKNAIDRLTIERDALSYSLRNRPERPARPSGAATPAATCQGATGAELYRGDGEFLVRHSSRAEAQRLELGKCYEQYDEAKAKIDAYADAINAKPSPATTSSATQR